MRAQHRNWLQRGRMKSVLAAATLIVALVACLASGGSRTTTTTIRHDPVSHTTTISREKAAEEYCGEQHNQCTASCALLRLASPGQYGNCMKGCNNGYYACIATYNL